MNNWDVEKYLTPQEVLPGNPLLGLGNLLAFRIYDSPEEMIPAQLVLSQKPGKSAAADCSL